MWSLRGWELGGQVISLREAYIQNLSLLGSLDPFKKFVVGGWVGGGGGGGGGVQTNFSDQP